MKRQSGNETPNTTTIPEDMLCQVNMAIEAIRTREPSDKEIHLARKRLKRARATLRLLRHTIGRSAYRRENAALRDAARPLSGVRDAAVLHKTVSDYMKATRPGPRRRLLLQARQALKQGLQEARTELRVMNALQSSIASLEAARARIRRWDLNRASRRSINRQGRNAFEITRDDPSAEHLHEWRKQVKYLAQALKVWGAQAAVDVQPIVKRADKLADLLGTDHDLVVFEDRLNKLDAPHVALPAVAGTIADQRAYLLRKALNKGCRLFKARPSSFVRKIAH
jgi:CHAD domain-containing protein